MKKILTILLGVLLIASCSSDNSNEPGGGNPDNYNRKEMLTFWADAIIIPAYTDFNAKTEALKNAVTSFTQSPSTANLATARTKWQDAYVSWQKVAIFQIGKAQQLGMVAVMNTIPTNTSKINTIVANGNYNLESSNLNDVQGFAALDYLLNGKGTDQETVDFYTNGADAAKFKTYLKEIATRVNSLTKMVYDDWKGAYRATFINNDGSTSTSSVDKLVNFFVIPFYEKQFRDAKIAIPSGARTGNIAANLVEAFYKKDISKLLYDTSFTSLKNFYKGVGYDGTTKGNSLEQYLVALNRNDLVAKINDQLTKIEQEAANLNADFYTQVETPAGKQVFLKTYDAIQALLKSFKPDMMNAMGIQNTSPDSDND